jgi:hypothetical protein
MTKIPWYNLLTRDHMYCTMCYRASQVGWIAETKAGISHPPDREPWVRIADTAWFEAGITPTNPHTKAAYMTKLRAAFKRHVETLHPTLPFEIVWHLRG